MTPSKAAVLAIGTEITDGQTINRNASWISQRLLKLGLPTLWHLSVPDERELIRKALALVEEHADLLFVTGGLGPTTDDFTRDLISEWSGHQLQWSESAWTWIQDRLTERKIPVREFQKQQCFFPEGADILHNALGTAHGFGLFLSGRGPQKKGIKVFVLPGPPREVESVWNAGIHPWLSEVAKGIDKVLVRSWDCFGVGESEIAHRAETALKGTSLEKGYRVHLPYVEFKLFGKSSQQQELDRCSKLIDEALGPFVVAKEGADPARSLRPICSVAQQIEVVDEVTHQQLFERWNGLAMSWGLHPRLSLLRQEPSTDGGPGNLRLALRPNGQHEAWVEWTWKKQRRRLRVESPAWVRVNPERERQYFCERAILFWADQARLW